MSLSAIILAAGRSTRMKSRRPKVLHDVCGRPMLHYVLKACYDAGCRHLFVVVGHGKDEVISTFAGDDFPATETTIGYSPSATCGTVKFTWN